MMEESIMTISPKTYVAGLAAINAGTLRGTWIDATRELGEIQAKVQATLEL